MLRTLYESLFNRLQTLPELLWIDLWNSQTTRIEKETLNRMPAVFIGVGRITWATYGQRIQRGQCELSVHVVQRALSTTRVGASLQAEALARLELIDSVHAVLTGYAGPGFTGLERTVSEPDEDTEVCRHDVLRYTTLLTDQEKGMNATGLVPVHPWQEQPERIAPLEGQEG